MIFFWSTQHLSLVSRKIQIKAALRFSFILLKMAKDKQGNDKKNTGEILGKKNHYILFMGV